MSNLLESYRVLGVQVGAGMADVTTSYRKLCRTYHPDITDDPEAEELMKQINIAYTVLREKFRRESAFRDRQSYTRPVRRYPTAEAQRYKTDTKQQSAEIYRQSEEEQAAQRAAASVDAEKFARAVLHDYFIALNTFDYVGAYNHLSEHDKRNITPESFTEWREAVARLYPMREFKIAGGSSIAVVTWGDDKTFHARKFRIIITEGDYTDNATQSDDIDKLVINENGQWGVFLGYREISELTRTFDKRFENKKKQDIEKLWDEYVSGLFPEYNMLNAEGMRESASKELYRQRRYGGTMTFAAISIQHSTAKNAGKEELLRSAAKTICGMLRETDVPAYTGDGVFAIMFVELGKKNAENIINRLIESIRKNVGSQLGMSAEIEYEYGSWTAGSCTDIDMLNEVLKKFNKKM
ncbi:MAG: DnaJ domain-containing protein [Oscillospiraceae bacterium]|jgi:curved DNA-binding protein CbpA|nr:DnaJ domain-containing protein [Oscillospiraceae bacterium]